MTLKPFWEGFRGDGFSRDIAHNWISVVRERERETDSMGIICNRISRISVPKGTGI